MKHSKFIIAATTVSIFLTGCGEIITPEQAFVNKVDAADAMSDRLDQHFNTAWGAMPTSGQARYVGYAGVAVDTAPFITILVGDAVVDVDFGADDVSGRLDGFSGFDNNDNFDTYSGEILLTGGTIGQGVPNDLNISYAGALAGNGDFLFISGEMAGKFIGDPIRGIELEETTATYQENGFDILGGIILTAEN